MEQDKAVKDADCQDCYFLRGALDGTRMERVEDRKVDESFGIA